MGGRAAAMGRVGGGSRPPPPPGPTLGDNIAAGRRVRRPLQAAAPPRAAPYLQLGTLIWRSHVTRRMRELAGGSTPRRRPAHPPAAASSVVARGEFIQIQDGVGPTRSVDHPRRRCVPVVRTPRRRRPPRRRRGWRPPRSVCGELDGDGARRGAAWGCRAPSAPQRRRRPSRGCRGGPHRRRRRRESRGAHPQWDGRACRARVVSLSWPHLRGRVGRHPHHGRRGGLDGRRGWPLPPPPPPHRRWERRARRGPPRPVWKAAAAGVAATPTGWGTAAGCFCRRYRQAAAVVAAVDVDAPSPALKSPQDLVALRGKYIVLVFK